MLKQILRRKSQPWVMVKRWRSRTRENAPSRPRQRTPLPPKSQVWKSLVTDLRAKSHEIVQLVVVSPEIGVLPSVVLVPETRRSVEIHALLADVRAEVVPVIVVKRIAENPDPILAKEEPKTQSDPIPVVANHQPKESPHLPKEKLRLRQAENVQTPGVIVLLKMDMRTRKLLANHCLKRPRRANAPNLEVPPVEHVPPRQRQQPTRRRKSQPMPKPRPFHALGRCIKHSEFYFY